MTRMSRMKMWLSFAFLLSSLFGRGALAKTITATNCTRAVVAAAIASAAVGDIVVVPAGTCDWTGGLSISGIQLIGAGKSTSGTVITAGGVTMTKHATQHTRVSGFRFSGTDNHITINGNSGDKAFIVDNNYLFTNGADQANRMVITNVNGGVFHHNDFAAASPGTQNDPWDFITSENWSQAPTYGSLDTTGERNIYIENNTMTNIVETAPDGSEGARLVIRYNDYYDSSIVFHGGGSGGSGNDTGITGIREFEIYNNNFHRVSNLVPVDKWIWARGSSGVIANNAMDSPWSPDRTTYANKTSIRLGVDCPNPYPLQYQVGQSSSTPENPPSHPVLIFGNTGAALSDPTFLGVVANASGQPPGTCSNPSNYIQVGRDYMTSNTWGWTPYTYPHPLTLGQSSGNPPAAPSSLSAVVQ